MESFITISTEDNEIVIDSLFVAPHERRLGRATEMVQNVIDDAFLNDEIELVSLYAYPNDDSITQEDLVSFYEKIGFEQHPDSIGLMLYKV